MTGSLAQILNALAMYIVMFAVGAWIALFPNRQTDTIEKRMAAGDDRFFEEQRAHRSYPRLRDTRFVRGTGIAFMVLAAALGAVRYTHIH